MKKLFLLLTAVLVAAATIQAKDIDEIRIYLNPGHGSWGPNDRPMATIPYPMLEETGRPDTCGFYESNTNLWKSLATRDALINMGIKEANITMSRTKNGPYPYVDGADDQYLYNRNLTEIATEVQQGNFDMFFSHHSNAYNDGSSTNYALELYRGTDGEGGDSAVNSRAMATTIWPYVNSNEIDVLSYYPIGGSSMNVRGDISFMGSKYTTTIDGKKYIGYYGVLRHGIPGFLLEGYFHTYQPARHRALNQDYCRQEGVRVARGMCEYFNLNAEKTGYIMGTVKDVHNHLTHNLYKYSAGSIDQWYPLDNVTVNLKKNGSVVATYQTDTLKNGVFVFNNLTPGTYTLDIQADGYKALGDYTSSTVDSEWQEYITKAAGDITVTANQTTYVVPLLEQTGYEPPAVIYENYPEPELEAYVQAPSQLNFVHDDGTNYTLSGTIKRMLVRGDTTIVLTNDADLTPHLYAIDNVNKVLIKELSTNGVAAATEGNATFYSRLQDIAFTADDQLVGINCEQMQFDGQVPDGSTRGVLRVYKWATYDSDPVEWVTTTSSANFYRYKPQAIAIDGEAAECTINILGTNDWPNNSAGGMRFLRLAITDNVIASTTYTESTINASSNFTRLKVGTAPVLVLSPLDDNNVVLDGEIGYPMEVNTATANGTNSAVAGRIEDEALGAGASGVAFFKYAGHSFMVSPYMSDSTNVGGVKLYDVTNGFDNYQLVKTTNTDLTPASCTFMSAGAAVSDGDIILYLMQDNKITKFMADDEAQDTVVGIFAYGLTDTKNDNKSYTFTFNSNSDAKTAKLIFYDAESGEVVGEVELSNIVKGSNTVTLTYDQIPGDYNQEMNWAVNLTGENITTIKRINPTQTYSTNVFCAVDKSPESKHMGTIYAGNRVGSNNANNGIYVCDVFGQRTDETCYRGGHSWGSNYRMGIDANGKLYIPDWGDAVSGVYVADPDNMSADFTEFFVGERATNGMISNNGANVGSSTPSAFVAGTGANTKLYVYLEDFGNGIGVYNIGNADGSIATTWSTAPSNYIDVGSLQANTNGNVIGDSEGRGVWVSQNRGSGNNTAGVPSLIFADNEGNVLLNSGKAPYSDYLNGSGYSGFAVNDANDMLVINDASGTLQFFDLTWDGNTPTLTPLYSYKADARTTNGAIYQMAFDYGGNLVCSGSNIGIYSMPTDSNDHTTPAMKSLIVVKEADSITVTGKVTEGAVDSTPARGIRRAKGDALANAEVTFSDGTNVYTTTSASDGTYSIKVPAGSYTVTGDLDGYQHYSEENVTIDATNDVYDIELIPEKSGIEEANVNSEVVDRRYIDMRGIEHDAPVDGVNIVVTRYSDGTTTTTKVIK